MNDSPGLVYLICLLMFVMGHRRHRGGGLEMTCPRGTSNSDVRGNSTARRKRRQYVVQQYRANVDLALGLDGWVEVPVGQGEPACRCYRCGRLLTENTISIDRITPGCEGGKYTDPLNLRPACLACNSATGGALGAQRRKAS